MLPLRLRESFALACKIDVQCECSAWGHCRIIQITSAVEIAMKGVCEISRLMMTARGAPVVCMDSLECYQKSKRGDEEVMGCISLLAAMCGAGVAW